MAKFTLTAVKGTDFNANLEMEATPAEVAQMLVSSRETMKDLVGLFGEAKTLAKEFYEEFKPILQRRAAAALDRDGSSWVREEEMSRIKHEIEMEKLRIELAELKAKASEKDNEATIECIRAEALDEGREAERAERYSRNTVTGTDAKPTETSEEGVSIVRINNGDLSRRVSTTASNETSSGVRVVRVGGDEIHARRIAATTATYRDQE